MGEPYAAFIEAQLAAELARRDSVNTRAATVLTSAVGLVTLALAVIAVLRGKDFVLNGGAKAWLVVALLFLCASALCAVGAGFPWTMKLVEPRTLYAMVDDHWTDSDDDARNAAAYANVVTIESLQPGTKTKTWLFLTAGAAQILAVIALAICVALVAFTAPHTGRCTSWGTQSAGFRSLLVPSQSFSALYWSSRRPPVNLVANGNERLS
ncbi:hypothetical protein [Mycobacterium bohemicum]|nr:hypothetical protein [Mycobacterium bohemicum]MCV6968315.1 hypothetical protein [Mycobacterium bohemicum]